MPDRNMIAEWLLYVVQAIAEQTNRGVLVAIKESLPKISKAIDAQLLVLDRQLEARNSQLVAKAYLTRVAEDIAKYGQPHVDWPDCFNPDEPEMDESIPF